MGIEQQGQHSISPDIKAKIEAIKDPNLSAFLLEFAEHVATMQNPIPNKKAAKVVVAFARSYPGEPNVLADVPDYRASVLAERMANWVSLESLIHFVPAKSDKHIVQCVDQEAFLGYAALGFGFREHYELNRRTGMGQGYIKGKKILQAVDKALGEDVRLAIRPTNVPKEEYKRMYAQKLWEIRAGRSERGDGASVPRKDWVPQQPDKIPFRIIGEIPVLNSKDRLIMESFDTRRIENILSMYYEGKHEGNVGAARGFKAAILQTRQLTAVINYLHAINEEDFSSYDPYPKSIDPNHVANHLSRLKDAMPLVGEKVGQDVSNLLQFFEVFAWYGKKELGLKDIVMSGEDYDQESYEDEE